MGLGGETAPSFCAPLDCITVPTSGENLNILIQDFIYPSSKFTFKKDFTRDLLQERTAPGTQLFFNFYFGGGISSVALVLSDVTTLRAAVVLTCLT